MYLNICAHHKTAQWLNTQDPGFPWYIIYIYVYININIYIWNCSIGWYDHLRHTNTENITAMGKVDTSDFMMAITRVIDISSRLLKFKWAISTFTTPRFAKKLRKVTERTNYILETLWSEYTHQAFTPASRIFHRMCSMELSKSA